MDPSKPSPQSSVIPFRKLRPGGRPALEGETEKHPSSKGTYPLVFLYTIDLLMEDFGKKHDSRRCVLCEPMKVAGMHRDKVALELAVALFKIFFPSFQNYVLEVREKLVQGLLDRRDRKTYPTVKDKIKALLTTQIQSDIDDFLLDIQKHLQKFSKGSIDDTRVDQIALEAYERLQNEWMV